MGSSFHESIVINSHVDEGTTQYMMTSSSSSDQEEEEEEEKELAGVGRSYECVFCKRGFNTAQALGGHMNIHRKHTRPSSRTSTTNIITNHHPRTTNNNHYHNKPSTATSSNQRQMLYSTGGPRMYQQIISPSSANHFVASHHHHEAQPSFYNNELYRQPSDHSIVVPADNWRLRLSLEFSPMNIVEEDKNKQEVMMNQKEEEQLDLELRLGYI